MTGQTMGETQQVDEEGGRDRQKEGGRERGRERMKEEGEGRER